MSKNAGAQVAEATQKKNRGVSSSAAAANVVGESGARTRSLAVPSCRARDAWRAPLALFIARACLTPSNKAPTTMSTSVTKKSYSVDISASTKATLIVEESFVRFRAPSDSCVGARRPRLTSAARRGLGPSAVSRVVD